MDRLKCRVFVVVLCGGLGLVAVDVFAQKKKVAAVPMQHDTAYYVSFPRKLTTRFYFSRKFTAVDIHDRSKNYTLHYLPNTTLNMGVGATYKWATLNLAYGFGFLNPDRGQGKTKYLDLQFHSYGRKVVFDVFGQFYRGFYLSPKGVASADGGYYVRPDLHVNQIGIFGQYVLNNRRFSYRASFLQNEWQKKSAGSFLFGFEGYTGRVRADSSIVPTVLRTDVFDESESNLIRYLEFGPNVGYAYTLVYKKHFFITGSGSVSLDYGHSTYHSIHGERTFSGFTPNTFIRFFGGYNSAYWAISVIYINNAVSIPGNAQTQVQLNTGNFRLNFVKRFKLSKRTRKVLNSAIDQGNKSTE